MFQRCVETTFDSSSFFCLEGKLEQKQNKKSVVWGVKLLTKKNLICAIFLGPRVGISFIIGFGDRLGCGVGVCWNNLWLKSLEIPSLADLWGTGFFPDDPDFINPEVGKRCWKSCDAMIPEHLEKKIDKHRELWGSLTPLLAGFWIWLSSRNKINVMLKLLDSTNFCAFFCPPQDPLLSDPVNARGSRFGWGELRPLGPGGWVLWFLTTFRRWRHMDDPTLRNSVLEYPTQWQELLCSLGEALNETWLEVGTW